MSTSSIKVAASWDVRGRASGATPAFTAGLAVALALMLPQAWSVWTRGTFMDPDDALRTVEIRDFLAGQAWFDMVPHRLAPDHPVPMHWSRLVDAPLAVLQRGFETVLPPFIAERAMRVVAPVLFYAAALAALLRITDRTAGRRGLVPVAQLLALAAEPLTNFMPGHIHHHGLQAALLLGATAAFLLSIGKGGSVRHAAVSGVGAVVSLGVGLQNLPFVIGLVAASLLLWVVDGEGRRRPLLGFGSGLLAAVPVFLLDVPPGRYAESAADAFSMPHLLALLATAALCATLAMLTGRLPGRTSRLLAAAGGGSAVCGLVAVIGPDCLRDPMAGVDPLLRDAWLSGVGEALPLGRLVALSPWSGAALLLTLLAGLGATASATLAAPPPRRAAWTVLLGLSLIGFAGTLWQVRVAASTCTLLLPGVAWLVLRVHDAAARRPRAPALLLAVVAGAIGNGAGWSVLALPLAAREPAAKQPASNAAACFDPENTRTLATLPAGLVLSTIDPGSTLLASTPHTVLAAPYHRNAYGNRVSILALAATPDAAEPLIRDAGVRYIALCRASNETAETVARYPDSLSAVLMAGEVPTWLRPVGATGGVFLLYETLPASSGSVRR